MHIPARHATVTWPVLCIVLLISTTLNGIIAGLLVLSHEQKTHPGAVSAIDLRMVLDQQTAEAKRHREQWAAEMKAELARFRESLDNIRVALERLDSSTSREAALIRRELDSYADAIQRNRAAIEELRGEKPR